MAVVLERDGRGGRLTIDAYLAELERALPRSGRDRALREVREHLRDAAARHRANGATDVAAETAATTDFGPVDEVARRLSAELALRKRRVASALSGVVTVVAALVIAAVFYLDVHDRLNAAFTDTYRLDEEGFPTPVLVAKQTIPVGTPGMIVATQAMYEAMIIPKREVVEGAIADPSFLRGRATAVQLLPGEQLTAADFGP